MSKQAQLRAEMEAALQNPNVQTYLAMIREYESKKNGYNALYGNGRFDDFSKHPNIRRQFREKSGKVNYTTAAGAYQMLGSTWGRTAKRLGLTDFTPHSQDVAAVYLIKESKALDDVMNGQWDAALRKTSPVWASLPYSPYDQPSRSKKDAMAFLAKHSASPPVPGAAHPTEPVQTAEAKLPVDTIDPVALAQEQPKQVKALARAAQVAQQPPAAIEAMQQPTIDVAAATPTTAGMSALQRGAQMAAAQTASPWWQPITGSNRPVEPWQDEGLRALLDSIDTSGRSEAVAQFFGEEPIAQISLPDPIEKSINRLLATL